MTTMVRPYFLENPEWYTESYDEDGYVHYELTDKAPPKAVESFKEYTSEDDYGIGEDIDKTLDMIRGIKKE